MKEKSCENCIFAHANCEDKAFACEYEDHVCDEYMSITKIENAVIDRVLKIISDVRRYANNGYMFDMVDEIEKRVKSLKGEKT